MKNRYEINGSTTIIHMKGNKTCIISTSTIEKVKSYNWCVEGTGYVMSRTGGHAVKIHRIIVGATKGTFVDHIDGNPLNNTLDNLRICQKQQNEFNTKVRSDNSSGYKGVSYSKRRKCYRAYITKNGKQFSLGQFSTKIDAALAYNKAAIKLFGEFARLNLINIATKE